MSTYEGMPNNGHLNFAEKIFTKIKNLFDTKVQTDVPTNAVFTDEKVTQTESTANEIFEVLVSGTASTATTTEGANKSAGFRYNPSLKSVMEGTYTVASQTNAHAEGYYTIASGDPSHAEGTGTCALGQSSHAEGGDTQASGNYSHAEGGYTIASGYYSHAEGNQTAASNFGSHAEGQGSHAEGQGSHAEGSATTALGSFSHTQGYHT
jgi:hypothetical protein